MMMRSQAWLTAALGRVSEMPEFDEFVSGERNRAREVARWSTAWDKVDAALAANRNKKAG